MEPLSIAHPIVTPPKLVLIIEDEAIVAMAMAEVLELAGYRTLTAPNGQVALDQLQAGAHPDVIILDVMMPVMNGYEFHAELSKLAEVAETPIVLVTADGEARTKALTVHAVGYLVKPFAIDTLLEEVERATTPAPDR